MTSAPRRPVLMTDASGKLDYARGLAAVAAGRGNAPAHHALAATLRAAGACYGRNAAEFDAAVDDALAAIAALPTSTDEPVDVLTDAELLDLRAFVELMQSHMGATVAHDDLTPAQSDAVQRDGLAFDLLILSKSLSDGHRTAYGPNGDEEDAEDRVAAVRDLVAEERFLDGPLAD